MNTDDEEIRLRALAMERPEDRQAREQQERATAALVTKALEPGGARPAPDGQRISGATSAMRDGLVRLARKAVAGTHVVGPDGSETKLPEVLMLDADDIPPDDAEPSDLDSPARRMVDPRTMPARFHHLRAAGQSGAHALHAFQGDSGDSLSRRLGSGCHALLLGKPCVLWDQPAKSGKGKAKRDPRSDAWKEFTAANAGAIILNAKEMGAARRVADAIHAHPIAERLLFGPGMIHERSIIWTENGRARQSTPDARGTSHLVELKTTRCAAPWRFVRDAANMGYHAQLADQRAAIAHEQNGRAPREVYIVAVENVPPYVVQVYELPATTLELGDRLRRLWLERLQIFEATDLWGGYSPGIEQLEILHDIGPAIADPEWVEVEDAGKEASPA